MYSRRRFLNRWPNLLALLMLGTFFTVALAAPSLAPPDDPHNPETFKKIGRSSQLVPQPPSSAAILGTTPGQFDIFYTLVWGTRSALSFGIVVAASTALLGTLLGALSAYFGGWFNQLIMRITDGFLTFPVLAGVVMFQQLLAASREITGYDMVIDGAATHQSPLEILLGHINPMMLAFILFSWMPYTRIINSLVYIVKQRDFIQASLALGSGHTNLLFRHILPNTLYPSIVLAARDVGGMVIMQATIAFIGLGAGSPWGELLAQTRSWIIGPGGNIFFFWWVFLPATLTIILFGISWNLLGDGLNEWLNPRFNYLES